MCMFSAPSPPTPAPPPPPPAADDASVKAAAAAERDRARKARGRASTILTEDGTGAPGLGAPSPDAIGRKTLLGA